MKYSYRDRRHSTVTAHPASVSKAPDSEEFSHEWRATHVDIPYTDLEPCIFPTTILERTFT